ncbi:MAG: Zn-ribbon domain-containing OB-fold protein [Blastocatellia bacterium]|nr:Zn-ribbon domain-containing OB-fold protein [Blastocatellia bacterium]
MADVEEKEELIVYRSSMRMPYRWAAGMTATKFYREIAENQKLYATYCPICKRNLFPARKSCSRCFTETSEWVEVASLGTIETFTIAHHQKKEGIAAIYALIKLDGADTAFIHKISTLTAEKVKIGARVRAVFAEKATGNILDIKHFELID